MTRVALPLICLVALTSAACDGDVRLSSTRTETDGGGKAPLKVIDQLQCPQSVGVLTRKATAHDQGQVCIYTGPRGAEVTLHLVGLKDGDAASPLQAFEKGLAKGMPNHGATLQVKADETADRATVAAPGVDIKADGEDASVRLPGMHVETKGDKADVRIGPIHIRADDSGGSDTVSIQSGDDSVNVQAHEDGAEVRTKEAGAATRTRWLLTDSRGSADGWKVVGYEARGPEGGPVVVVTFKSKDERNNALLDAAKDLLALNVGK